MSQSLQALLSFARDARAAGRRADGRRAYDEVVSRARLAADRQALAHALRHASDMDREDGCFADAADAAREAVDLYRTDGTGKSLDLANALRLQALASEALGVPAETFWLEARALYLELDVEAGVAECDRHLSETRKV